MLQPSQIETVSRRFQGEIAEVRGFLRATGIPVETPPALDAVVRLLESNRAFHRDLGSHAWMLLYSGTTVPETLAVLAVATLGARFAATADEDSTHDLLRFVMESRSQLAGKAADSPLPVPHVKNPESPLQPVKDIAPEVEAPPSRDARRAAAFAGESLVPLDAPPLVPAPLAAVPQEPSPARPSAVYQPGTLRSITPAIAMADEPVDVPDAELHTRGADKPAVDGPARSGRGRIVLYAVIVLLVLAVAAWWYFLHSATEAVGGVQTAPVVDGAAVNDAGPQDNSTSAPGGVVATPALPQPAAGVASPRTMTRTPTARSYPDWGGNPIPLPDGQARQTSPAGTNQEGTAGQDLPVLRAANSAPAPITRVAPPVGTRGTTPVIPSPVVAAKAANGPVSNSVLAGRLGSPVVNQADAVDDRVAGAKGYPRLLRRKPLDSNGTLVAKATPPVVPGTRDAAIPSGTVRSTSLGISAGNLVYAPDPAYPATAASQHISGQVTVQAMVDREGNVASARVISGPPMLRDAAVNAVQQWRYRPYTAGGKPQTFTATAVMDFQLQ